VTGTHGREALQRALELSREVALLADHGDIQAATRLDAERLQLLKTARAALPAPDEQEQRLLEEINTLNAVALGALQHRQRAMARDMDMMSVGRRAMRAYSVTGQRR
jgi:hypothetical protein